MIYQIPYAIARQIADHAQDEYPNEVCGLLAGHSNQIQRAIPITNVASHSTTEYKLDPIEQLKALKQLDVEDLQWIGVYHSHPKSPPIVSKTDIQNASDSYLLYVIVSLQRKKPKLKAWKIQKDEVEAVDLLFDTQTPDNTAYEPLSKSQKVAIILSGIISVLLLLTISLTLLPPAPEITPIP